MTSIASLFLIIFIFFLFSSLQTVRAQGRAPHGLSYENPVAFSPLAFEFFHPKSQSPTSADTPCVESNCAPKALSSPHASSASSTVAASTLAHESKFATTSNTNGRGIGAGGVIGVVFGFAFVVVAAMGVHYVVKTHRTNAIRAKSVHSDA